MFAFGILNIFPTRWYGIVEIHFGCGCASHVRGAYRLLDDSSEVEVYTTCLAHDTATYAVCHGHCLVCGTSCRLGAWHQDCGRCWSCCTCARDESDDDEDDNLDEDSGVQIFKQRPISFWVASKLQHKRNPSKRFIAAEIEVSHERTASRGCAVDLAARKWGCSIVSDGSLNSATGYEINTSPASGDRFCEQIEALCEALQQDGAQADSTCGLHVHVDARDFSWYDLRRIALVYAACEGALFATQPQRRRNSHFCEPCGGKIMSYMRYAKPPKQNKQAIIRALYPDHREGSRLPRTDKYDAARYAALNLHSWVYRGTIECRMHAGTVRAEKIIGWGLLWAGLLDYAMCVREKDLAWTRAHLSFSEQQRWLLDIAPTNTVRSYLRNRWRQFNCSAPQERSVA